MSTFITNPFHQALTTANAAFAVTNGPAVRYEPGVIPFGAVAEPTPEAYAALRDLLAPDEELWTIDATVPAVVGLAHTYSMPGLQMHYAGEPITGSNATGVLRLTATDVPEMIALKALAFPGYFGERAFELGDFFGIRINGELVAMCGERLATPTHREISALCTHPAHTGKGFGAKLIHAVMRAQAARGMASMLHVVANNERAIGLYKHLGFVTMGEVTFQRFKRQP